MAFYKNFVSLCNSVGKSPTAVILEIGLERSSVTRWKKGGLPSDATALRIANYFKITAEELMKDENHPADGEEVEERVTPAEQYLLRLFRLVPKEQQETVLMGVELTLRSQGLLK